MKKDAKWWAVLIVLIGCAFSLQAAENIQKGKTLTSESYSRLSLTFYVGAYSGESAYQDAAKAAEKIKFSDKYNNHNLKAVSLPLGQDFRVLSFDKKKAYLKDMLEKQGIGRSMVAKWFSRQENGMMNLDYVHQSGMYNATDQDVKLAQTAKRGDAFLKDAGQNLVDKSYVLILVPTELKSHDDGKTRGWNATYDLFFYKLQFDPDVVANFYNVWPYEDDAADIKQNKIAAFDTLNFKFTDVYSKSYQLASTNETLSTYKKNPKTLSQLMDELTNSMYTNSTFLLDKDIEDFRVKTKVSKIHPVKAKIGKKEGLKCDNQFFVYQYKFNEKTGKADPVRKAVVRSTSKIVDNRQVATGSSPESSFYQTYGGTIQEGMILQQRLDFGLSVIAGGESGGIGGVDLGLMFRTGPYSKVSALYVMFDYGLQSGDYAFQGPASEKYTFHRISGGLGKGFRFARIVELTPYAQYGVEFTKNENYYSISTNFVKLGAMLGFNLTHNISLLGQVNNYSPMGDITVKVNKDDKGTTLPGVKWTDEFTDRSGMGIMVGLRIEF